MASLASIASLPPLSAASTVVFVTSNAPYRENKHNTSRMIRDALPSLISRPGKPDIVILKYYRDSPDTYEDILKMVEEVWNARRSSFLPEPSPGHEDEVNPDEDGVYVDKDHFLRLGLPASLEPIFDADTAVAQVKTACPDIPIRASDDPNHGFCEYRLYSSLAEVKLNHTSKIGKAAFLHVPTDKSPEAIKLGADIVAAYITALVDGLPAQSDADKSEL